MELFSHLLGVTLIKVYKIWRFNLLETYQSLWPNFETKHFIKLTKQYLQTKFSQEITTDKIYS